MLFQCLPESLLDRQVRFWLVLSLKTLALRRSTECRHRIYTCPEHKIPCRVERKIWVPFEETVPQRREGELFFSLGKYAYQRGRCEPHIRGAGIPFSNWTLLALPCCCLACAYPKDAHQQQPSSSCPSGKGLDKQLLRLCQRGGCRLKQLVSFPGNFSCSTEDLEGKALITGSYEY